MLMSREIPPSQKKRRRLPQGQWRDVTGALDNTAATTQVSLMANDK